METLAKIKFDFIEKLLSLPYFMLLLSLALFTDAYLLAAHKTTIRHVTDAWFESHSTISELLAYAGCIGFFYAAVVPGLQFFVGLAYVRFSSDFPSRSEGWVHVNALKEFAIRTRNPLAYQECEVALAQVKEAKQLEGRCLSLLILSLVGYALSNEQDPGLFQFIYYGIEDFPWYVHWPLKILVTPFICFVIMVAFRGGRSYDGYVRLPDFQSWSKEA